jgi:hypothetical protein
MSPNIDIDKFDERTSDSMVDHLEGIRSCEVFVSVLLIKTNNYYNFTYYLLIYINILLI